MKQVPEKPEHIGVDNKPTVERDRIDLNHEISGEPTGRIQRFLTEKHRGIYGESEKKKSERRYRTMLELLLAEDAQYAKLYSEVKETLDNARRAVNHVLLNINQRLEESERMLRLLQDNAARLNDGTMVFLSTVDGNVYAEDGRNLPGDEAQNIDFAENAPSWEEYKSATDLVATAQKQKAEIETYQRDVLDRVQVRMNDADDPPSLEELKTIERDIQTQKPEILSQYLYREGIVTEQSNLRNVAAAQEVSGKSPLNMPPINTQFDIARLGIPDSDTLPKFTKDHTVAPAV